MDDDEDHKYLLQLEDVRSFNIFGLAKTCSNIFESRGCQLIMGGSTIVAWRFLHWNVEVLVSHVFSLLFSLTSIYASSQLVVSRVKVMMTDASRLSRPIATCTVAVQTAGTHHSRGAVRAQGPCRPHK